MVYKCLLAFWMILSLFAWSEVSPLPEGCHFDEECIVELPESLCGDGTRSYYKLTLRKNSPDLLIYLESGGACWSQETCRMGHVLSLSRKKARISWVEEEGLLDLSNPAYPFYQFSQVTIPYCTGDVFLGDRDTDYGSAGKPAIIRHRGYKNVLLTLNALQRFFPSPERVVLLGRSAGALGVLGHLRNLDAAFPHSQKFVLADAGTPFMPPFLFEKNYRQVMHNWNAFATLPPVSHAGRMDHFGDLVRFNTLHFPHIRFGLIQSYEDRVMTYFAKSLGSPDASTAVRKSMIEASDHYLGLNNPHAKVFFLNGKNHVITKKPLREVSSENVTLLEWLQGMFENSTWHNVRPDLRQ
ncbi:hypothetical protein EBR78_05550 [bacterium]|nr:hypothetical protein [bacterium]